MAESHSEDSPLLSAVEPSSPDGRTTENQVDGPWIPRYRDETPSASASLDVSGGLPQRRWLTPTPEEGEGSVAGPVHSQASMDSGCDCGASEADMPSRHWSAARPPLYPLISSQPLLTGRRPDGAAPLAQKESLECHCDDGADQRCLCYTGKDAAGEASAIASDMPKVSFRIEGYEDEEQHLQRLLLGLPNSSDEASDAAAPEDEKNPLSRSPNVFPKLPSNSKLGMLSASSSTASMPMCRICHFPQGETPDALISPCRCAGTMQFIHESCLMKWLDVSKTKKAAACELCNYQYNRHKKFRLRHWELPSCSRVDKFLHIVFLLCLLVMAACAAITVYCFKQDRFIKRREDIELTKSEIITLTCGVLFFVAFFTAMYVEVKAKETLYRLFNRFVRMNQTWHIDDYDKRADNQDAPV